MRRGLPEGDEALTPDSRAHCTAHSGAAPIPTQAERPEPWQDPALPASRTLRACAGGGVTPRLPWLMGGALFQAPAQSTGAGQRRGRDCHPAPGDPGEDGGSLPRRVRALLPARVPQGEALPPGTRERVAGQPDSLALGAARMRGLRRTHSLVVETGPRGSSLVAVRTTLCRAQ